MTTCSAGWAAAPPPNKNGEDGAGATAAGTADGAVEANKSAVPAGVITVGAPKGSASAADCAATATARMEPDWRAGSRAAGLPAGLRVIRASKVVISGTVESCIQSAKPSFQTSVSELICPARRRSLTSASVRGPT